MKKILSSGLMVIAFTLASCSGQKDTVYGEVHYAVAITSPTVVMGGSGFSSYTVEAFAAKPLDGGKDIIIDADETETINARDTVAYTIVADSDHDNRLRYLYKGKKK